MEAVLESFGAVSLHVSGETKKHHEKPQYRPSPRWNLNLEPSEYGEGTSTSTAVQSQKIYIYIYVCVCVCVCVCLCVCICIYTVCTTRYRTRLAGGQMLRVATIRCTTDTLQTHSFSFLTQRTYSCLNFVAISSLVLELFKKFRVR